MSTEEEKVSLKKIQDRFVVTIPELPDEIETDAYSKLLILLTEADLIFQQWTRHKKQTMDNAVN